MDAFDIPFWNGIFQRNSVFKRTDLFINKQEQPVLGSGLVILYWFYDHPSGLDCIWSDGKTC